MAPQHHGTAGIEIRTSRGDIKGMRPGRDHGPGLFAFGYRTEFAKEAMAHGNHGKRS